MPAYGTIDAFNYPGSSGYSASGQSLITAPTQPTGRVDYPVWNPTGTGTLVSVLTGKPWSGPVPAGYLDPRANSTANPSGVQVPFAPPGTTINPNDPTQRYKPVSIPKNPDIASGEQNLMQSFKDAAASSLQDFSSYLKNFTSDLSGARTAGAAATNIAPTVNALQTGQAGYASGLNADQAKLDALLKGNATAEQGIVAQDFATLPQYDTAAQNVADQQMAAVEQQLSRYKMNSGTPTSVGSDEERLLASEAAKVYAPLELAKIQAQQNVLTGVALPVQQDITNRQTSALTQFDPAAQAAIWSSGRATAQDVQNLKQAVAGMSYAQAVQFMQAIGIPAQIQQSILSGQAGILGQLNTLESGSRYQGLQDVLGAFPSQPVGYNTGTPGIPNYEPRNPGVAGPSLAPNAPVTVGAAASPTGSVYNNPSYSAALDQWLAQNAAQGATGLNPASYAGGSAEGTLVAG